MIKRLLVNSIKDVLGEILFKKQKKDLFNYQRIVANSISKNKTLNIPEEKNFETSDSENELEVNKVLLDKVGESMILTHSKRDTKTLKFIIIIVQPKRIKKIFEIISIGRCLKLGFEEFIGCKKNIQKSFKKLNIFLIIS